MKRHESQTEAFKPPRHRNQQLHLWMGTLKPYFCNATVAENWQQNLQLFELEMYTTIIIKPSLTIIKHPNIITKMKPFYFNNEK